MLRAKKQQGQARLVDPAVEDQHPVGDLGNLLALARVLVPEAAEEAGVVLGPVHLHRHHELRTQAVGDQHGTQEADAGVGRAKDHEQVALWHIDFGPLYGLPTAAGAKQGNLRAAVLLSCCAGGLCYMWCPGRDISQCTHSGASLGCASLAYGQ